MEGGNGNLGKEVSKLLKIIGFQGFLGDGIIGVGIKSGGDAQKSRLMLHEAVEGFLDCFQVGLPGRVRGKRIIETVMSNIDRTRSRITRVLMNRGKVEVWAIDENGFGAVAMMNIEIKDCNGRNSLVKGFKGRNGDRIEVAESHGPVLSGMVTGRAHETEGNVPLFGQFKCPKSRSNGPAGVLGNVLIRWGISIKIMFSRLNEVEV